MIKINKYKKKREGIKMNVNMKTEINVVRNDKCTTQLIFENCKMLYEIVRDCTYI